MQIYNVNWTLYTTHNAQRCRKWKSWIAKIHDTFDRAAVKIHGRWLVSCSRAKACNFSGFVDIFFWNFPRGTFLVERATQLWRSMRKTTSCKKTPDHESPGCSSSLIVWPIRSRPFKCFWNWSGKSKCPGAALDVLVTFHHELSIVPTRCSWVCEDRTIIHSKLFTITFSDWLKSPGKFFITNWWWPIIWKVRPIYHRFYGLFNSKGGSLA